MLRRLLATSLCVVIAACATKSEWVKPDMTSAKRDADLEFCSSRTDHTAPPDMIITIMDRCMAERGYQKKAAQ